MKCPKCKFVPPLLHLEWRDLCSFLWHLKWDCQTKALREQAKLLGAFLYYVLKSQVACRLPDQLSY